MNLVFIKLLKGKLYRWKNYCNISSFTKTPPWNVLFFGADEFSIYSLKALHSEYLKKTVLNKLEVVTTIKGKWNPVRKYANEHKICVHSWPNQVPKNEFDLGLVVSFGHLIPEAIITQFPFGMLNVHASLLPRWRGAAPIIYALANGDKETGVTIMRIRPKHFDTGEIISQIKIPISNEMKFPELHKILGELGAQCLIKTIYDLPENLHQARLQPQDGVTYAPKVTSDFAVVRWDELSSSQIYNLDRAMSGLFPLTTSWEGIPLKLIGIRESAFSESAFGDIDETFLKPGFLSYNKRSKTLKVVCAMRTCVSVEKIGVFGKRIMTGSEFCIGYCIHKLPPDKRYFK
ncbi:hypothetical protein NQ318_021326 [Aromia moschata]|uniref:Methionyl-tRNA formyltransferase, mitochondrial n=1 Tax=Aromia moschata TaxID=1265417 RepID=A0AAV8ZBL8_9CUCU|nr:hypothetical protein NQ318_021326 [Aromia moschata]